MRKFRWMGAFAAVFYVFPAIFVPVEAGCRRADDLCEAVKKRERHMRYGQPAKPRIVKPRKVVVMYRTSVRRVHHVSSKPRSDVVGCLARCRLKWGGEANPHWSVIDQYKACCAKCE